MESSIKKSFDYFSVSPRDRKWGWHITTVGETRILPGQTYPPQGHPKGYNFDWSQGRSLDCFTLVYISRGGGWLESIEDIKLRIEAGQVFLLFPGVWHRYRPDPETGWDEHWVGFDGNVARRLVRQGFFSPLTPVFKLRQEEKWLTLFADLIASIRLHRPALQQLMAGSVAQMLGLLYSSQQESLVGNEQVLLVIQKAIVRMQTESETRLDLQKLATDLNMSYSSFRHSFQKHTGSSPHQYLLELRLARARNLLTSTTHNVKEVSQMVGFDDEHYFSRFFKNKVGCTPIEWRLQSRRKNDGPRGK